MNKRRPAVAGMFYPGSPTELRRVVDKAIPPRTDKREVLGLVAPHAGYMYSGAVAGAVYAAVKVPERMIILCPNHTGMGAPLAIMGEGVWETPLGDVPIDGDLAESLMQHCPSLEEDEAAHRREHSLEVQLPFLQVVRESFRFVPVTVGTGRLEMLLTLGQALATAIRSADGPVLLVSSSDMTHYQPEAVAARQDELAIERMVALDPQGLHRVVREEGLTMCGAAPTVAVMEACRRLGGEKGELVRYATSGEVTGDRQSVVAYAGVIFY